MFHPVDSLDLRLWSAHVRAPANGRANSDLTITGPTKQPPTDRPFRWCMPRSGRGPSDRRCSSGTPAHGHPSSGKSAARQPQHQSLVSFRVDRSAPCGDMQIAHQRIFECAGDDRIPACRRIEQWLHVTDFSSVLSLECWGCL